VGPHFHHAIGALSSWDSAVPFLIDSRMPAIASKDSISRMRCQTSLLAIAFPACNVVLFTLARTT
jgi:hypothetical protein